MKKRKGCSFWKAAAAVAFLLAAVSRPAAALPAGPPRNEAAAPSRPLEIELLTDRKSYYPGEPIFLQFSIRNISSETLRVGKGGRFWRADLYTPDGLPAPLAAGGEEKNELGDFLVPDWFAEIKPGEKWISERVNILAAGEARSTDYFRVESRFATLKEGRYALSLRYKSPPLPVWLEDAGKFADFFEWGQAWPGEADAVPAFIDVEAAPNEEPFESGRLFEALASRAPSDWYLKSMEENAAPAGWIGARSCAKGVFEGVPGCDLKNAEKLGEFPSYSLWICPEPWRGIVRNDPLQNGGPGAAERVGQSSQFSLFALGAATQPTWPGIMNDIRRLSAESGRSADVEKPMD